MVVVGCKNTLGIGAGHIGKKTGDCNFCFFSGGGKGSPNSTHYVVLDLEQNFIPCPNSNKAPLSKIVAFSLSVLSLDLGSGCSEQTNLSLPLVSHSVTSSRQPPR